MYPEVPSAGSTGCRTAGKPICQRPAASGATQPTLDVIRRLAVALQVSADVLIFGADEHGPEGNLQLQFEAISRFTAKQKKVIKALLEGMILKHEAKHCFGCLIFHAIKLSALDARAFSEIVV